MSNHLPPHWKGLSKDQIDLYRKRNKKLVDALESGGYAQGQNYLTRGDKNCCLGVACKVAIDDGVGLSVTTPHGRDSVVYYDGHGKFPPKSVRDYYGWESKSPELTYRGKTADAVELNDRFEYDFLTIAKFFAKTYVNVSRRKLTDD